MKYAKHTKAILCMRTSRYAFLSGLTVCLLSATALSSEFSATATITSTNGTVRTIPLVVTAEPDGGRRVTVKAADAQGAKWVDVHADCATARTGDDGYWITQRGLLGYFTRKYGASVKLY